MVRIRIISIMSTKGGVGKTTIASNLALALQNFGKKTALVDFNFTTPHVSLYFNIFPTKTLNNFLRNECQFSEILHNYNGLTIIPSSLLIKDVVPIEQDIKRILEENLKEYEFVILDSAPGLGREAMISLNSSHEVIFVSTPDLISLVDVTKTYKFLQDLANRPIVWGIVLNKVRGKDYELNKEEIERYSGMVVLGSIKENEVFIKSINERKPAYYLDNNVREEFNFLAAKIAGVPYEGKKKFKILDFIMKILKR
ncbi:MAG: MinD/ParA family protein [Candidatus Aenigmatarchaeota archaeon]